MNQITTIKGIITVRQAVPSDAEAVRELRIESLSKHPEVYAADHASTVAESIDQWKERISKYDVERNGLICMAAVESGLIGMSGQPKSQYYFHRPVSTILRYFFANGFVLDAYEEPSFANIENSEKIYDNVYKYIPPALICRLRI